MITVYFHLKLRETNTECTGEDGGKLECDLHLELCPINLPCSEPGLFSIKSSIKHTKTFSQAVTRWETFKCNSLKATQLIKTRTEKHVNHIYSASLVEPIKCPKSNLLSYLYMTVAKKGIFYDWN